MMRINNLLIIFLTVVLVFTGFALKTYAEDLSGRDIIEKVYNRDEGEDREASMKMILTNQHGDQRERNIKQFNRDFGEVEKKIMFFTAPSDIRGTSFMNWSYDDGREDSQWIYLPALRKVKRISAANKSDYFMGSDFTFDDLGERNLDDDTHILLGSEEFAGEECYVVESVAKDEDYMYSKTITWVSKDRWIGLKREFYDPDGELLKILTVKEYETINGIVTITASEMHNVQKDHKTSMDFSYVRYNVGIPENRFSERQMKIGI